MPDNSPRITLVIHSLAGGGAERQMGGLANYLSRQRFACTLITLDRTDRDRYPLDSEVIRVGLDQMMPSRSIVEAAFQNRRRMLAVRKAVIASQPQAVISFCDKTNIIALAACRPLPIPLIISERSDPRHQRIGWLWEAGRRWHYPQCSACVVQSQRVADYLRPVLGKRPTIEIIPSAIEPPSFPGTLQSQQGESGKRLLYVGRLAREKGADRLLEVWSSLSKKHPDWRLVLCGDGPMEASLKQLAGAMIREGTVEFVGWQPDIWPILRAADAYVLPSYYEGFPNALVEAMYVGLPVLATDCSAAVAQLIEHGRSGLIAENDLASLTDNLDRLLNDSNLREKIRVAGQQTAARYTWRDIGPMWTQLIRRLTKEIE